jgi:myo-inositol-1(or 4)-monophosphatase
MFGEDEIRRFHTVADQVQLLRYGYDCYAYAMLAMGFIDCVIEAGLQPYDIEPLVPVIEGAGGCVTDWDGNRKQGGGQAVAVGDRRLLEPVLKLLADG